jgi:hypothetical protein
VTNFRRPEKFSQTDIEAVNHRDIAKIASGDFGARHIHKT